MPFGRNVGCLVRVGNHQLLCGEQGYDLGPSGVQITCSSMRAAERPSAAGQNVSSAKNMPSCSTMGSSSELSRLITGRSWTATPTP